MHQELITAITEMDEETALALAGKLLDSGVSPIEVLDDC